MVFTDGASTGGLLFLLFMLVLPFVFLCIFIPILIYNKKYEEFVLQHSNTIKNLKQINGRYDFKKIPNLDMQHKYDNDHFYDEISLRDYLTYQLVYKRNEVDKAISDIHFNKKQYDKYVNEVTKLCTFDSYDTNELLPNTEKLHMKEKKLFEQRLLNPIIELSIKVKLIQTKINGERVASHYGYFDEDDIREIEHKLDQKRGTYYLDREVWDAICRVERGKVSNKMRFAIYERDGYRCCMCGKKRDDLEIDHIIPISKGGKSTYENLQTLCHRCNAIKGDKLL